MDSFDDSDDYFEEEIMSNFINEDIHNETMNILKHDQFKSNSDIWNEVDFEKTKLSLVENAINLNLSYQESQKLLMYELEELKQKNIQMQRKVAALSTQIFKETRKENLSCKRVFGKFFMNSQGETPAPNTDCELVSKTVKKYATGFKLVKWSENERLNLAFGVRQENQKILIDQLVQRFKSSNSMANQQALAAEIEKIKKLPVYDLELNLNGLDWETISKVHVPRKTDKECKIQWTMHEHPLINKHDWTDEEIEAIKEFGSNRGDRTWESFAQDLGTNRTAAQCFILHQRNFTSSYIKGKWTSEEDELLKEAVSIHGTKNWTTVASFLEGRTPQQCLHRWQKAINPGIVKGKWTREEDEALIAAVNLIGSKNWNKIQTFVPSRTDMQCRERWVNSLNPELNQGPWSEAEDLQLLKLVDEFGVGKWSQVASYMRSRTDNQCLRRWRLLNSLNNFSQKRKEPQATVVTQPVVQKPSPKPTLKIEDFLRDQSTKDTFILQSTKFTPVRKEEAKIRFPASKFTSILNQFDVYHPTMNSTVQHKEHIESVTAECSNVFAMKQLKIMLSGVEAQTLPRDLAESDEFKLLEKRFNALFIWPTIINRT